MLDDKVQAGYEADQCNDFVASGRIWLDAWSDVLQLCDTVGAGALREREKSLGITLSVTLDTGEPASARGL